MNFLTYIYPRNTGMELNEKYIDQKYLRIFTMCSDFGQRIDQFHRYKEEKKLKNKISKLILKSL